MKTLSPTPWNNNSKFGFKIWPDALDITWLALTLPPNAPIAVPDNAAAIAFDFHHL